MNRETRSSRAVRIEEHGLVAIVRAAEAGTARRQAAELLDRGVGVLEVALTTPGALTVIEQLANRGDEALIGAGTVLDAASARAAILAGARFLVTPSVCPEVIEAAHRYGAPVLAGALTPTEIGSALGTGADLIKLFPAASMGPGYLEAVSAAFPQAPVVPTGGIEASNAAEWLAAGAVALGVGSALSSDPRQLGAITAALEQRRRSN